MGEGMVGLPAIFLHNKSEGESREGKGREGKVETQQPKKLKQTTGTLSQAECE